MNLFAVAFAVATAFAGPNDTPVGAKKPAATVYGETQKAGKGSIRTFVRLNEAGKPAQVGVAVSEATINSLPMEDTFWSLAIPKGAESTHLKHVFFGWMPHGHEPDGVYNVPHFDCHFYYSSHDERVSITDNDPRFAKHPDAAYVPEKHIGVHPLAQMGVHWVDTTSPELNGKPFTTTFIYGSLDGQVTFVEPMFTLAFLKKVQNERVPVKQPAKVAKPGLYPTSYAFTYNAAEKQYEIVLDDLTERK